MSEDYSFYWDRFLLEGEELFNYMIHNFDTMLDGDIVKHFDIRSGHYGYDTEADEINEKYAVDIQKNMVKWIKNEFEENKLFDKNNWKPFRDQDLLNYMYLGYRKMFQYKQYYFQLAIENMCGICDYCKIKNEDRTHFELALYGWKDENSEKLQPYDSFVNLCDNMMTEKYWKRK